MRQAIRLTIFLGLLVGASGCGGPEPQENVVIVIDTSKGKIKAALFGNKAPITVRNFMRYVDEKFYDGLIFHRVIADFMIQGGGMLPGSFQENRGHDPIRNESGNNLLNLRGTLAMARTDEPNSATSQFFINVKDNPGLDRANARDRVGYAVFGKVIEGMDVVDAIRVVPTRDERPIQDVIIKSIRRAE